VLGQLRDTLGDLRGWVFEIHAGRDYYAYGLKDGLVRAGATVELPAEGLPLGQRLAYYATGRLPTSASARTKAARRPGRPGVQAAASRPGTQAGRGTPRTKYLPLYHHLVALDGASWQATFAEVEDVLGFALPASARNHQAWWANDVTTHSHARAWLAARYRTAGVNLTAERVTFRPA
jgi:hypothetical protein